MRSQSVMSNVGRGGRRSAPYAFTEQGVAMLSSVLNSELAITINIEIMRAFVRIRELLASDKALAAKFAQLERKLASHDQAIIGILSAIRELMNPPQGVGAGPLDHSQRQPFKKTGLQGASGVLQTSPSVDGAQLRLTVVAKRERGF